MRKLLYVLALGVAMMTAATASSAAIWNFSTTLDGAQEVPSNASPATGSATATYDDVTKVLTYSLTYSGLTSPETAAHIHGPAPPGMNAGVIFTLPPGSPKNGSTPALDATQEGYLFSGLLYFNVHTLNFPGGEIRGQIIPEPASLIALALGSAAILLRRRR